MLLQRRAKAKVQTEAKHLIKVHAWAGISHKGHTKLCTFEGKMNVPLFEIWRSPSCHSSVMSVLMGIGLCRTMIRNTPKFAWRFYAKAGIDWWPTRVTRLWASRQPWDVNENLMQLEQHLKVSSGSPALASSVFVFMVRGLFTSLKFPHATFPCKSTCGDQLVPFF